MSSEYGSLVIYLEQSVVQTLQLEARLITVGRAPENILVLADPLASRRHAELRLEHGMAVLTDLGSTTGTFVGETRLAAHQPHRLAEGATFSIGRHVLVYRSPEQQRQHLEAQAATGPGEPPAVFFLPSDVPLASPAGPGPEPAGATAPAAPPEAGPAAPPSPTPPPPAVSAVPTGRTAQLNVEQAVPPVAAAPPSPTPPPPAVSAVLTGRTAQLNVEQAVPPVAAAPTAKPAQINVEQAVPPVAAAIPAPAARTATPYPARQALPADAVGPRSRYLRDLPVIYHEHDFLGRFLMIFESIWEPLEQRQDYIDHYFNPRTGPARLLPWLSRWIDLPIPDHWPEERRRRLLAAGFEVLRWRGTHYGLTRLLEVCTGATPVITDMPGQPCVLRIQLTLPPAADVDRALVEALVKLHKPAHAGYVLEVG